MEERGNGLFLCTVQAFAGETEEQNKTHLLE
jgi:hypothetical protein